MVNKINKAILHPTWATIYSAVGENDEILLALWDQLSGQQLNMPTHLNSGEAVEKMILDMVSRGETIDIARLADETGFSRRWVRQAIQRSEKQIK